LDGFFNYHKISITLEDWYKTTFVWVVTLLGVENKPLNLSMCYPKKKSWNIFYEFVFEQFYNFQ